MAQDELYGVALIRWFEGYLSATDDDHLTLLEGDVPLNVPDGLPGQQTRRMIEVRLKVLRQFYLGEADTHRDWMKGENGRRGQWAEKPVNPRVTTAFTSFVAPDYAIWLNDYRRRVLAEMRAFEDAKGTISKGAESRDMAMAA